MNPKSDEVRATAPSVRTAAKGGSTSRASGRKRVGTRSNQYMVAPAGPALAAQGMIELLQNFGDAKIMRTLDPGSPMCPSVAVVQMTAEKAAALRLSAGGTLIIEADQLLRAASLAMSMPSACTPVVTTAQTPGFATTIQVTSERDEPVAQADVQLIGQQWAAQGITGNDGSAALTLYGELPETITELLVEPRAGYWGAWRRQPDLQTDAVSVVSLRPLSEINELGWGARAMQFDQLPQEYRGRGTKIALIDSGVATSHKQLTHIDRGFDTAEGEGQSWSQDAAAHGTLVAGIIGAASESGMRGYAQEAELHVCKLPPAARCSDLVAALDYAVEAGIDLACLGFGCQRGSAIVEQRIVMAKQAGLALIAAAGSTGGPIHFPACSPHVLAVGAIGQSRTFPEDSPQAACAATAAAAGEFFVPAFSCRGPELDLCAPGVAVVSCQSPDGHAVRDGTSLAAAHVAALAALLLAHHADFHRGFANRDGRRVERLFQILKETARPLGDPLQTGAGLAGAPAALGLQPQVQPFSMPLATGLEKMRIAMQCAGVVGSGQYDVMAPEPPRGPAFVAHLPLNAIPAPAIGTAGAESYIRALKTAMQLTGLFAGR